MRSKIETWIRTVRQFADDSWLSDVTDPHGLLYVDPAKIKTYCTNPFLVDLEQPCQLIGVKDGRIIGRRNSFPSQIVADGVVCKMRVSGSVYVDPEARSSLYAISLLRRSLQFPDGDLNINCGLSYKNQKFYELLGSAMFKIVMFAGGGRWFRYYKGGTYTGWKAYAAKVVNAGVYLASFLLDWKRWSGLPNWTVQEVDPANLEFISTAARLVSQDRHRYRQDITREWIKWVAENDFESTGVRKMILGVYGDSGLVGFGLVRMDSNKRSVKIFEWQVDLKSEGQESHLLCVLARYCSKFGYRVQIAVAEADERLVQELERRFPRVGFNYSVVTIADGSRFKSFDGIGDAYNWRIRPGMGDAAFW